MVETTTSTMTISSWGKSTVHGLGFGKSERLRLDSTQGAATANVPSYNEIGLGQRDQRVPLWRGTTTPTEQAQAIHTLLECYDNLQDLKQYATDYQWTTLRQAFHDTDLWTRQLETAAAVLRPVDPAVGFNWASCAWRHCGALADIQESIDELDALAGVLEPFEALFCLDIVERGIRDILTEAPWQSLPVASADVEAWRTMPPYQAHRVFSPPNDPDNPTESLEAEEAWKIDEEYIKALQDLRIDE